MEWVQLILSLCGIIGLIFFMFFFLKRLQKGGKAFPGAKLRAIDRINVGRDSAILVVCVCGKLMLIGVSSGGVQKICDLEITEEQYFCSGQDQEDKEQKKLTFSEILKTMSENFLNKNKD